MVEQRSEGSAQNQSKEHLQPVLVEKVFCSQLLSLSKSGKPIYQGDYVVVQNEGAIEALRVKNNADLIPFIDKSSGSPDVVPLNRHNLEQVADHITYLNRADFTRNGQKYQVSSLAGEPLDPPFKMTIEQSAEGQARVAIELSSVSATDTQIIQYAAPDTPIMLSDYFSQVPCILLLKKTNGGEYTLFMYAYTPKLESEEKGTDHEDEVDFLLRQIELNRDFGDDARYEVGAQAQVNVLS